MRRKKIRNPFSLFAFQDIITSVSGIFIFLTLLLALELVNQCAKTAQMPLKEQPRQSLEKLKSEITILQTQIKGVQKIIAEEVQAQKGILLLSESEITVNSRQMDSDLEVLQKETAELKTRYQSLEEERKNIPQRKNELASLQQEVDTLQEQDKNAREKLTRLKEGRLNIYFRSGKYKEKPWIVDISGKYIDVISLTDEKRISLVNEERFLEWAKQRDSQNEYLFIVFRPSASGFAIEIQEKLKILGLKMGMELMGENEDLVILDKDAVDI